MEKLMVETCIDVQEIGIETEEVDEYNALAVDLGLEHLAYKDKSANIAPMNQTERKVYETLCPTTYLLKNYKHHIPKRVLQAMQSVKGFLDKEAEKEGKTVEYEVWVDEHPDPVLIAKIGYTDKYLIGRWGHELDTFNELYKRAIQKMKSQMVDDINRARSIVNRFDSNPDEVAEQKLNGNLSSIYW